MNDKAMQSGKNEGQCATKVWLVLVNIMQLMKLSKLTNKNAFKIQSFKGQGCIEPVYWLNHKNANFMLILDSYLLSVLDTDNNG